MRRMKRKIRNVICMVLVLSLFLTGCGTGKTDDGKIEVNEEYYALLVMNQNGEVVSNAKVIFNGVSATTGNDGIVRFLRPEENQVCLSITCLDYYDYLEESYQVLDQASDMVTIKSKSLESHHLETAMYNNTDAVANIGVDLLTEHKKLNMSMPELDFNITTRVLADSDIVSMYELHQMIDGEDNVIAKSETGVFENLKVKDFKVGTNIYVTVFDNEDHQTSTALNLEIGENPNYTEYTELSLGDEITFSVADDIPIFGGTDFNVGFPSIPVEFVLSEEKVHIGFNVDKTTFDDEEERKEYKEMMSEIIRTKNTVKNCKPLIEKLKARQKDKGLMRLSGFDKGVDVCVGGYAEAGFDSCGNLSTGEGSICITITGEAEFGWQVIVWVIPVTINIEGEIEANLAGSISYSFDENKFNGDVAITIAPSITAKAGVGFEYLSAGVYGSAGLETQLIIASTTEKPGFKYVDFTSSLGIYAKAAFFEPEKELLTGTFNLWTRGEESLSNGSVEKETSFDSVLMEGIYDVNNYSTIKEADNVVFGTKSTDSCDIIASGINPGSSPISIGNGSTMLTVFSAQEQLDESESTYAKLYYSLYEDGQWSNSVLIDENIKNQMNPQLYSDGKDYYLMYQEADFSNMLLNDYDNKTVEERRMLMEQAFLSFDLHVKKFDLENKEFVDLGYIETPNAYDYNASMVFVDDIPYVYSVSNSAGDFFGTGETTSNNISCAYYDNGVWKITEIQQDLNSVTRLSAGNINGNATCIYSVDSDNDLTTTDDIVTYCYNEDVTKIYEGNVSQILNTELPLTGEKEFFIATEEGLYLLKDDMTLSCIMENSTNYLNKYAISSKAIYDVKKVNSGTEIFAMYALEDGSFSAPVQITFEEKWQKDISAHSIGDKEVVVGLSEIYDESGIETELVAYCIEEYGNLSVEEVYISYKEMTTLNEVPIEMVLKNSGNMSISGAAISVKDANGNELEVVENDVNVILEAGESQSLTINVKKTDDISYGTWTIEANILDENVVDINQEDNICEYTTGYSDFVVITSVKDTGTYPFLSLEVKNEGNISDSAQIVLLDANDTSKELNSYSISSLDVGSSMVYKVNLQEEWATNGKIAVLVKVVNAEDEMYVHNNYSYEYATVNYGTYNISYELNGGENSANNPETYTTADKIVLKEPTKVNCKFVGWYTTASFDTVTQITQISPGTAGNIALYAAWIELGDVNTSGKINAEDALLILKYVANISPMSEMQQFAADVNENGKVNAEDALQILKYVANMIQSFG